MPGPGSEVATSHLVCPACGADTVRTGPRSHRSGSIVATCKRCDCHWLTNPSPVQQIAESYDFDREMYAEYVAAKRHGTLEGAYEVTLRRLGELIGSGGRELFDVGAGAGEFVALARERGFEPHGNELAPGAIEMAKEQTGVELHHGDLSTLEGENLYDAVTMWCVLAHVPDPDDLLAQILRVLKPGGVLFLQTPRWSAMDTAGLTAARLSRGRVTRVLDRRVTDAHIVLNSRKGLTAQAERAGFEIIEIKPVARYSLQTQSYLRSLGLPERAARVTARGFDVAVDRDLFFRNVLDLYARKPLA